jgi:SAM-dependent methyltransferase
MNFSSIDQWAQHQKNLGLIRLHLGCGTKYLQGWCNIDANPSKLEETHRGTREVSPDIWADILTLPADDCSTDIIYSAHVVEHLYRHKTVQLFRELWRVLKPGGFVITEMPDLNRILLLLRLLPSPPRYPERMNANRDMIKAQLYGAAWETTDEGYQCHKYVWDRSEFCEMLQNIGYEIVLATGATKSHVPFRDMAVVCMKPRDLNEAMNSRATLEDALDGYGGRISRSKKQLLSFLNLVKSSFTLAK